MTRWWIAMPVVVALVGCRPRLGEVSGTVTVDGSPLDYGIVNFVSPGGAASAPVLAGKFEAGGVPVGAVRIAVRALPRPVVAEPAAEGARPYAPLPERYLSSEQSGLSLDVKGGRQRHDISISAK